MRKKRLWVILAGIVVSLVLPLLLSPYYLHLVNLFIIAALFALSFNLIYGYMGQLTFGHAAFFGVGAYATALFLRKAGFPYYLAFILSIPATTFVAMIIGYFCSRVVQWFFSILTLAFGQLLFVVASKWYNLTAGDDGIQSVFPPSAIISTTRYYFFSLIVAAISGYILWRITTSPFGYTLLSIRDNPQRSESIGINVRRYRWMAFVLGGIFAGIAGNLFVTFNWAVAPTDLEWTKSAEPVVMTLLGGQHFFAGPIIGAAIFTFLQFYVGKFTLYWALVTGIVLLLVVRFMPGGMVGFLWQKIYTRRVKTYGTE